MSYAKPEKDFLLVGKLAELANVSRDTLRHYERKGVLPRPARSPKGYRLYSAKMLARVQLIRRALAVGFTLDELARILAERDCGNAPCRAVRNLAVSKLKDVKLRLQEMEALGGELERLITDWDEQLEEVSENERAHLLETMPFRTSNYAQKRTKRSSENLRRRKIKEK